ncbi:MAG: histidine kinase [Sulfuricurvum sp.]
MENGFDSLKHRFPLTEEIKEEILQRWMGCQDVRSVLEKHAIGIEFFARYFGAKVINYAAGVIKGTNRIGNCPVIGVMLVFFEKKNIPLGDVFTVCVNFKNVWVAYALEKNALDHFLLHEICTLIDTNFQGVISEYLLLHYNPDVQHQTCQILTHEALQQPVSKGNNTYQKETVTSASAYILEVGIEAEILEELRDIEEEALDSLGLSEMMSLEAKEEVCLLFGRYLKMLERLMEFQELSYALAVLIDLLKKADFHDSDEESMYVIIYIKAIIGDLSVWRKSVFVEHKAEDIHYLDKTLLSSIAQLQILLSPVACTQTDDVEFF